MLIVLQSTSSLTTHFPRQTCPPSVPGIPPNPQSSAAPDSLRLPSFERRRAYSGSHFAVYWLYLPPKTDNYAAATEPRLGAPFVRSGGARAVAPPSLPPSPWIFVGAPSKTLARSSQNERSSRRGGWKLELIFSLFLSVHSSLRPSVRRPSDVDRSPSLTGRVANRLRGALSRLSLPPSLLRAASLRRHFGPFRRKRACVTLP